METYHVGLIALGFFALFILFAFLSWRRKIKAQEKVVSKPQAIEDSGNGLRCFYVATTFAGRPLDRVIAHGLAHRGHAGLLVTSEGVQVSRTGEVGFLIPSSDLLEVSKGAAVIDRVVEKEGLVVLRWRLGSTELETHFRFVDAQLRSAALAALSSLAGS